MRALFCLGIASIIVGFICLAYPDPQNKYVLLGMCVLWGALLGLNRPWELKQ